MKRLLFFLLIALQPCVQAVTIKPVSFNESTQAVVAPTTGTLNFGSVTINATAFTGSGAGLTGLNAATVVTADDSTDTISYPVFVNAAGAGNQVLKNNAAISFNSADGQLNALVLNAPTIYAGSAGVSAGSIVFANGTSGSITIVTPAGALGSRVLTMPVASGTFLLTDGSGVSLTNIPITALTASTAAVLGVGSIELGNALDTTLARSIAGVVTIESNPIVTDSRLAAGTLPGSFTTLAASGLETLSQTTDATTEQNSLLVATSATATSGNPKWSPTFDLRGQGFNTSGSTTSNGIFRQIVRPTSAGTSAASWLLRSSVNGGAFATALTCSQYGDLTAAGNVTSAGQLYGVTLGTSGAGDIAGNFTVATNKFSVTAASGNTTVAGTSTLTGALTLGSGGTSVAKIRHGISGAMVLGAVTVTDTGCTANTRYFFSAHTLGTISIPGGYYASTRTASTSFIIQSSQPTETSTIDWLAIEP